MKLVATKHSEKDGILREFDSNRDLSSGGLRNRDLWLSGILIADAWLELAEDHERERYSELEKGGGILGAINSAKPSSPLELSNALSAALKSGSEKLQLMSSLRELLLDRLFNDELHAYGYALQAALPLPL